MRPNRFLHKTLRFAPVLFFLPIISFGSEPLRFSSGAGYCSFDSPSVTRIETTPTQNFAWKSNADIKPASVPDNQGHEAKIAFATSNFDKSEKHPVSPVRSLTEKPAPLPEKTMRQTNRELPKNVGAKKESAAPSLAASSEKKPLKPENVKPKPNNVKQASAVPSSLLQDDGNFSSDEWFSSDFFTRREPPRPTNFSPEQKSQMKPVPPLPLLTKQESFLSEPKPEASVSKSSVRPEDFSSSDVVQLHALKKQTFKDQFSHAFVSLRKNWTPKNKKPAAEDYYTQGLNAESQGNDELAASLYRSLIETYKIKTSREEKEIDNQILTAPYFRLALIAWKQEHFDLADRYFRESIQHAVGRNQATVSEIYARFCLEQGHYEQAEIILRNALINHPKNTRIREELARSLVFQERPIESLRHLKTIYDTDRAYEILAEMYRQNQDDEMAEYLMAKKAKEKPGLNSTRQLLTASKEKERSTTNDVMDRRSATKTDPTDSSRLTR